MEFLNEDDTAVGTFLLKNRVEFTYYPDPIHPRLGIRATFVIEERKEIIGFWDEATPYDALLAESQGYQLVLVRKEEPIEAQVA